MNALTHDFVVDRPFADPARIPAKFRPLKALGHFRNLIKDKENTAEVFPIFEALPRRDFVPSAKAYLASEAGRKVYATEAELPPILDDHQALRGLPAGTVAHAYCDFMEAEGLTAGGLVEEEARSWGDRPRHDDLLSWYGRRHRDTHDLLHVLTGYGRDALGEQCVLAFTYSQSPSPAHLFLGYAGAAEMKRRLRKAKAVDTPIFSAVREAQKLGKACPRVAEMPIRELLAMPLEEARAKFNITRPRYYHEVHRLWREHGIDPHDLLSAKQAA
jgi:ubiquinone biosynthesis protein COQ4